MQGEDPLGSPERQAAFRAGEQGALTAVYRAYVKDVANLLLRGFTIDRGKSGRVLGVSAEEQREMVQEVFIRAFKPAARERYDPAQPYRPYLLRIAKNLMIDRLRRGGREVLAGDGSSSPDIEELAEKNAPVAPYDEDDLDGQRLAEATRAFIAGLPEEERRFVQLRFLETKSQAEVAEALGITRRRVRTLEGHARERLREHLSYSGLLGLLQERVGAPDPKTGPDAGPLRRSLEDVQ